tara:strand:+ start:34 stop:282 length:249 start_codon:yes stop_codon:yes gene_type:complete
MNIKEKENVNHSVIKNSKGDPIMVVFKDKVTDEVTSIKHIQEKVNNKPTESEVIDCLASLPFKCYFGKDRDGILEITIPVKQ